ncbi:CPBP family intramembrane glutamic endopeptidase [Zobellia galactanivorans]|uniref:Peptidase, family U48 n=1 Tax=Zobellia galactanivorans (strain DSM 12802 / CCUG 47099 / CIP 106680 / NCIMB 13871 / Dsij) TaxID=63186 RepID=G0L7N5_ZOBGA|nr:CPBP family intramembrane glutamic endopeptidase [Zobellia galactanivorans]CAZ98166.1 Peptidase, family U48 [Zobellia galactanivorans]
MYIAQAYRGLSDSWRYVIGLLVVFFVWQFIGGIPLIIALLVKADSLAVLGSGDMGVMADILGANTLFFLMLLTFVIGLIGLFAYVSLVHKQKITQLTTSRKKIDFKRVFFAFFVWALISTAFISVDIVLSPENYEFNFNLEPFLILAVIAVLMIPLQTSMEEYYMRGYMMQGLGIMAKNRWVPLFVTSLLFGIMHVFNPEVAKMGYGILIFYIGTGFFLGIITLMDEGLELALGFHAANNLTAALLVTADWTAFQTNSLYRDVSDPVLGWDILVPVFVIYPLLLYMFSKKYKWTDWKERLTGDVPSKETFLALNNDNADVQDPSSPI